MFAAASYSPLIVFAHAGPPTLVEAVRTNYEGFTDVAATFNCEFIGTPLPRITWSATNRNTGINESISTDFELGVLIDEEPIPPGAVEFSSELTIFLESVYENPTCIGRSNGISVSITSNMFTMAPFIVGKYTLIHHRCFIFLVLCSDNQFHL